MESLSIITASALFVPSVVALALPLVLAVVARRNTSARETFEPVFVRETIRRPVRDQRREG